MAYYPVLLDLSEKKTVVIGGGKVGQRKIETLLEYGASVNIISRQITPELQVMLNRGDIKLLGHEYDESLIEDAFLIIIATDDRNLNKRVSAFAKERNILVNTVDQPEECSFIVPSIIKKGDLILAISTSGKSPALAKKIREELENRFGIEYKHFLNMMGRLRNELISSGRPENERTRIFHNLVDSPILKLMATEDTVAIAAELGRLLDKKISPDEVKQYMKDE
jgi:precorrin-2 dehydrogenase / sirohydrochlorin ferrochelatase